MINNIADKLLDPSFRNKVMIAGGMGLVAGVALSILLGCDPTLFSSTVPSHDYFWVFPTVAVAGLGVLSLPISLPMVQDKLVKWKKQTTEKKAAQQQAQFLKELLAIGEKPSTHSSSRTSSSVSLPEISPLLDKLSEAALIKEPSDLLLSWYLGEEPSRQNGDAPILSIVRQTTKQRENTKQGLRKQLETLQTHKDSGELLASEESYRLQIFIKIQLYILEETVIPFRASAEDAKDSRMTDWDQLRDKAITLSMQIGNKTIVDKDDQRTLIRSVNRKTSAPRIAGSFASLNKENPPRKSSALRRSVTCEPLPENELSTSARNKEFTQALVFMYEVLRKTAISFS